MNDNLACIMTFNFAHECGVIRSLLESEGITTFLNNENIVQVDPFMSNAVGGVQLFVSKTQFENAKEILKDKGFDRGIPVKENPLVKWINKIMK